MVIIIVQDTPSEFPASAPLTKAPFLTRGFLHSPSNVRDFVTSAGNTVIIQVVEAAYAGEGGNLRDQYSPAGDPENDEMMELLRRTRGIWRPVSGDPGQSPAGAVGDQQFSSRGENADDLFQVGCIGLIKAIDNFNIRLDVRFSTYGVPMIIGEIRRYLRTTAPSGSAGVCGHCL